MFLIYRNIKTVPAGSKNGVLQDISAAIMNGRNRDVCPSGMRLIF